MRRRLCPCGTEKTWTCSGDPLTMAWRDLFGSRRTPLQERRDPTVTPVASLENPSVSLATAEGTWVQDWAVGGYGSPFGPPVNEHSAMAVSAVYRCVTLISGV